MPESDNPSITVDRYGGIFSMTAVLLPWWHWRSLLKRLRHPLRRPAQLGPITGPLSPAQIEDAFLAVRDPAPTPDPGLKTRDELLREDAPKDRAVKGKLGEALALARATSTRSVPCHHCCGGPKALGHEPGCPEDIRRRAASGRYDD